MDKVTVILNGGPHTMLSWNGIRIAGGLSDVNVKVEVILFDEAVLCAKKMQEPSEHLRGLNLVANLIELVKAGIKVWVCGTCSELLGVYKEDLIEGVEIACLTDVANSVKTSKQTLVF